MGWLIALGILIALAWIPVGVDLRYDEGGLLVKARALGIPVWRYPGRGRPPKLPNKQKEEGQSPEPEKPAPKAKKTGKQKPGTAPDQQQADKAAGGARKGGSLGQLLPLVKLALELLGAFRRKLRIDRLELDLILAGDDPCDLAVNYGRAWAALSNLLPRLERYFVIKKRDLEVQCDFTASETTVAARVECSITLGRILALVTVYGIRGLKEFWNLKKRKGGAQV